MTHRLPPLNALKAFDAAARHLSFSRAAHEDILNTRLFVRQGGRLKLSEEGLALQEPVGQAFDLFATAVTRLSSSSVRGEVVISMPPSLSCQWLAQQLREFLQRYPDISLRLVPSSDDREVRSMDVDLCIRYGDGAWPSRQVELLAETYLFPVCSPLLLSGSPAMRKLDDLKHAALLCADDGHEWDLWLSGSGKARLPTGGRHHLGNALIAAEMCASGYGVALGDNINTNRYFAEGRLVRPFGQAVKVPESFYLISRPEALHKPAISLIREWIKLQFLRMNEEWTRLYKG
jgi:LysR family transcriptional regulator, glycine cleavage system transcriptional activator